MTLQQLIAARKEKIKQYSGLLPDDDEKIEYYFTEDDITNILEESMREAVRNAVDECYLECLREERGEGECARAIRTKFSLKKYEK